MAEPSIDDIGSITSCGTLVLPSIAGSNLSGNQAYYAESGGNGTKYRVSDSYTSTQDLYIYDSNGECTDEKLISIIVTEQTVLSITPDTSLCDFYILPSITGTNLSGNQAFYLETGGIGNALTFGDTLRASATVFYL